MEDKNPEEKRGVGADDIIEALANEGVAAYDVDARREQFLGARTVDEIMGDRKITFHPELDKLKFDSLQGKTFLIVQVRIIQDWQTEYGVSDFPLLLIQMEDGKRFTTAGSGVAIMRQCREFMKLKAFPVKVTLSKERGEGSGREYNLFK